MHNLTAQVTEGFDHVFGSYGTDAMFIGLFLAIFFFYTFLRGKNKMVSLIFSFYLASVLYLIFPYTKNVSALKLAASGGSWSTFIVYIVIAVVLHLFLNRLVVVSETFGSARFLDAAILAITGTAGFISLATVVLPFSKVITLSQPLYGFFHQPLIAFVAIILPLGAIWWTNRY